MRFVYVTFFVLAFFLDPTPAFAWGPGMHLEIALTVLKHIVWCAPAIRNLIQTYPAEYIYGNVSPDIIVGKKYAGAMHHCHNWSIGKLILEEAKTNMDRASAWGYLTHLAADTVAHNYFVPFKLIQSYPNRSLGHVYWEMRFDLYVPEEYWKELNQVIQHDYHSFDHLLDRVLKKTLFSFSTNKRIFNSILIVHKLKQLRFGLKTYARASRWALTPKRVQHYKELVWKTVEDFLTHPEKAKCLQADPAGTRKLQYANDLKRELRKKMRRNGHKEGTLEPFLATVERSLEKSLYDPNVTLPKL